MKKTIGTIKFYNKILVKKTLGTGAFILVAGVSSSKPITIMCSVGAGLIIANIASKLKERSIELKKYAPTKSKRTIIVKKLKELKEELLNELNHDSNKEVITIADFQKELEKSNNSSNKEITPKKMLNSNSDLSEYIARQKELKK